MAGDGTWGCSLNSGSICGAASRGYDRTSLPYVRAIGIGDLLGQAGSARIQERDLFLIFGQSPGPGGEN